MKPKIKDAVDGYSGGPVDRDLVQAALDFMVQIQPSSEDPDGGEKYTAALVQYADTISKATSILQVFGAMIEPRTLESMQQVFYRVVNSTRYGSNPEARSCVYSCLNRAWMGIGPWQD